MSNATPSLDTVFGEAVAIVDPAARAAYLARACGGDDALRGRVEALVAAHFRAGGSFLEAPAAADVTADFAPAPEEPGTTVGPYKLLERIGEGGMGVVYVAEQTEPVRRRVALKVIKPGMDSKEVVARFEAERQALALMDHPNIAKVLDAGTTAAGRPYFVMELVRGLPITDYCDQAKLPADRRLLLFAQVCRAVQHAHQKGVIHRDLKPSNVLVTLHDGEPVPKVIDFGVAKAVNQQLTARTVYTRLAQLLGTPLYMAPEQAELSGLDIDTRSDVYSLGVLLYELLTGTTPFDPETFRTAAFDEMRRMIREDEPPRPSQRVSTLDAAARSTAAGKRGLDDRQLGRLLRGDLDWMVMKALEKDRNRRYESAGAFAADIERHLADKPVEARPPSAAYRLRKFARRNKAALATAAVLGGAVLAVAGAVGWVARERADRRERAEQVVGAALAESEKLQEQSRWPEALDAARRADGLLGAAVVGGDLRERVRQTLTGLELVARLEEVRLEYADAMKDRGFDAEWEDQEYARVFRHWGIDVDALTPADLAGRIPAAVRVPVAAALDDWAASRGRVEGRSDQGRARLLAAARAADPDEWRTRLRDAVAKKDRPALVAMAAAGRTEELPAVTLVRLGSALEAVGAKSEVIAVLRRAQERYPGDFWVNFGLARSVADLDPAEGVRYNSVALALRPRSAGAHNNLGVALEKKGDAGGAVAAFLKALRLNPDSSLCQDNLRRNLPKLKPAELDAFVAAQREAVRATPDGADAPLALSFALEAKKDPDGAVAVLRGLTRRRPDDAAAHIVLARTLQRRNDWAGATAAYREAIRLKPDDARSHAELGVALSRQQDGHGADAAFREAARLDPTIAAAYADIGDALDAQGDAAGAAAAWREAVRLSTARTRQHPDDLAAFRQVRSILLNRAGTESWDPPLAVAAARRVVELVGDEASYSDLQTVALALYRAGEWEAAIAAAQKAMTKAPNGQEQASLVVALCYARRGDLARAREWYHSTGHGSSHPPTRRLRAEAIELLGGTARLEAERPEWQAARARAAIARNPRDAQAHVDLGNALGELGDMAGASVAWREALRLDEATLRDKPADLAAVRRIVTVLASDEGERMRDPQRAVALARRAVELAGDKATYGDVQVLALILYRTGDLDAAAATAEKAIPMAMQGHPQADLVLALCRARRGDRDAARRSYDAAARWLDDNPSPHLTTRRLRAEAAALLGIPYDPKADPPKATDKPKTSDG